MSIRTRTLALLLAFVVGSPLLAAPAEGELGAVRGLDHVGFTVPDANTAADFFHQVVGCEEAMRFGPFSDDQGTFMQDLVNVHPRAVIEQIVMMRCGDGSNLELFQYSAPDQTTQFPRNSDYGGFHLAFYVSDLDAAVERAKALGLKTFMGPFALDEGPAAGQAITYVLTPWGQQLELITYPGGMAYEKTSDVRLWAPPQK